MAALSNVHVQGESGSVCMYMDIYTRWMMTEWIW